MLCTSGSVVRWVGCAMISRFQSSHILICQPSALSAYWVVSVLNERARKGGKTLLSIVNMLPGGSVVPMRWLGRDFGVGVVGGQG